MQPSFTNSEVLKGLGSLLRGLSAIFWGLPIALISYVQAAKMDWFDSFGHFAMLVPIATTAVLWYGIDQMNRFQPQERPWSTSLNHARMFVWICLGMAPFAYLWHRLPDNEHFGFCVRLLFASSIMLLFTLNNCLARLSAMIPDPAIRAETPLFTNMNKGLLVGVPMVIGLFVIVRKFTALPEQLEIIMERFQSVGLWALLFFMLLPLALTMAMTWKIKAVIFASVFHLGEGGGEQEEAN